MFESRWSSGYDGGSRFDKWEVPVDTMENEFDNKLQRLAVDVSDDHLQAWIHLCDPDDAEPLTEEEILTALEGAEIAINNAVRDKVGAFVTSIQSIEDKSGRYLIAEGRPAVEGEDGGFVRNKSLKRKDAKPEDDAPVDYHAFNTIITVEKDTAIGRITPAVPGKSGVDVHGKTLEPARCVAEVQLQSTVRRAADDPCVMIATIPGKIVFKNGALSIDEVITIKGDVDFRCGNIDASTDVSIDGTILDQFEVKSAKSISVRGTIQAAKVEAGDDVLVDGGIIGHHKGSVRAGGRIVAKFAEDADLKAESDIEITKEVMHSRVYCRGKLSVTRGAIIGGQVYAREGAELVAIGSEAFIPTSVIVGIHPSVLQAADKTHEEMRAKQKTLERIREGVKPLLACMKRLTPDQKEQATELLFKADCMASEISETEAKCEEMVKEARSDNPPTVLVTKTIHPGVRIRIGHRHVVFQKELKGPVRIEKRKIDSVTEFVAVSQASGSITVLKSSNVGDEMLEPPNSDPGESKEAS